MSHGPLIGPPAIVSSTLPRLFSTSRQPALAVAEVPSVVGRLPTITNPLRVTASAVVNPTPPGHGPGRAAGSICANTDASPGVRSFPPGGIWTIVVPVPCSFAELLKLLMSSSPRASNPTLRGTVTIPYGLTSPLAGTVVAIDGGLGANGAMNGVACALAAPAARSAPRQPMTARAARRARVWEIMDLASFVGAAPFAGSDSCSAPDLPSCGNAHRNVTTPRSRRGAENPQRA